ncbi:MAG TPA: translation initiation factor IF-3 [Verrucomicrobiae bacterium]|nr:translation initiation factor IF-3 [Verrucomicrobiae bacterium]
MSRPFSSRSFSPPVPLARVNGKIRAREVRVIDGDQKNLGVISLSEAITMARAKGVDLVEVNPNAVPPVCRLVDFGKFRYEQAKREKESRKHQHANKVKEIQLSPNIDPHDFAVKQQHAVDFLCEDMKVKVTLRFRGREMAHKEFGFQQVEKLVQSLTPFGHPDAPAKLIGKGINVMLSPLPRAKRGRNPRESGIEVNHTAPLPAASTPPAAATNNSHPRELRPVEADQRAAETASVGGQEFGNNAFANLEFKPRS